MKTNLFILFAILFLVNVVQVDAQHRFKNKRAERVESMKVAFLSQKMDLTPAEATVFWPVYNELREKLEELQREHKIKELQVRGEDESAARELIYLNLANEQKKLDLHKEYFEKLFDIISARKVILLKTAEDQFRRELLKEIRNRNG